MPRSIVAGALLLGLASQAGIRSGPKSVADSIQSLSDGADAIVVGSVAVQRQVGNTVFLVLQPRRVLKGSLNRWLDDWASLVVAWEAPSPPRGLLDCPYGIWFLTHDRTKPWQWSVLPFGGADLLRQAGLRVPGGELPVDYRYSQREPLLDKIGFELLAGIDSGTDQIAAVAFEALDELTRGSAGERVPSPFAHWATLPREHVGACPLARAAREWDQLLVARLEDYLQSTHAEDAPGLAALLPWLEDPSVIPALARIAEARPNAEAGVAATRALERLRPRAEPPARARLREPPSGSLLPSTAAPWLLRFRWPDGRWPAGCAAAVLSGPAHLATPSCSPMRRSGHGRSAPEMAVEVSSLCATCSSEVQLTLEDAWAERDIARLRIGGKGELTLITPFPGPR